MKMKVKDELIEQLFLGNINPGSSLTFRTEKYVSARKQDENLYEQFIKTLDENQKHLLDDLLEAKASMTDEMVKASFKDGFKLGMGLTVDGLSSNFIDDK